VTHEHIPFHRAEGDLPDFIQSLVELRWHNRGAVLFEERPLIKPTAKPTVVTVTTHFAATFHQRFDLTLFPYDEQLLTFDVTSVSGAENVVLKAEKKSMFTGSGAGALHGGEWRHMLPPAGQLLMASYISDPTFSVSEKTYSHVVAAVPIQRLPQYYLSNVVLLLAVLVSLLFPTYAVPVEDGGSRLQVQSTLFLAVVSYKTLVTQSTPRLPYSTVLDWYVLGAVVVMAASLVQIGLAAVYPRVADAETPFLIALAVVWCAWNALLLVAVPRWARGCVWCGAPRCCFRRRPCTSMACCCCCAWCTPHPPPVSNSATRLRMHTHGRLPADAEVLELPPAFHYLVDHLAHRAFPDRCSVRAFAADSDTVAVSPRSDSPSARVETPTMPPTAGADPTPVPVLPHALPSGRVSQTTLNPDVRPGRLEPTTQPTKELVPAEAAVAPALVREAGGGHTISGEFGSPTPSVPVGFRIAQSAETHLVAPDQGFVGAGTGSDTAPAIPAAVAVTANPLTAGE